MPVAGTHFGAAAQDYRQHRAGFPASFYDRLVAFGIGNPGQRLVDLGTGTGTLACGFASRGCRVTGIDPDPRMLDAAREQSRELNLDIAFRQGCAEATELSDACAEVVVAGQCWHWFDGSRAARECMRLLTPAGRLVIAHFDWLPYPGNVVDATEQLIKQANPAWHLGEGNGFYPQWLPVLSEAGFVELESFSYDVDVAYTLDAWRGRIQASAGIASLEADARERFDRALHAYLAQRPAALLPGQALAIPHRVFAIVGRASNKP